MAKRILHSVPIRILVVDPDLIVAESLLELLRGEGYNVQAANSGEAALGQALAFKPHLLIIEPHLRDSTEGIGLSNIILAIHPRAQVLFLTAWENDIRFSIKRPCGIISKPYDDAEMINVVRRCIKRIRQSKSLLFY